MERLLVEFARHADRGRFELEFVCLGTRGPIAGTLESLGWTVRTLEMKPGLRPGAMMTLARLFRSSRIDLVHTHNTKPLLYASVAAKIASMGGLVHTRHGQRIGSSRRQDAAFSLACKGADRVVCVSGATYRASVEEGLARDSLCTIENGIDVERFRFAGPQHDGPVLYVGRLSPEKGVDVLLHSLRRMLLNEPAIRLRIVGTGPSLDELRELARTLGVSGSVEFCGEVSDVAAHLRQASMLVLPSRSEGLSIAVLEAMGLGLPVVATRVGGTPEAVTHGVTGLLVDKDDVEGLASAVLRLRRDHTMAQQFGAAGRESVASRFDVRTMVARYEGMYAEVLEGRSAVAA